MPPVPGAAAGTALSAAVRGTGVAFVGSGFAFASWAARIPQLQDRLDLTPSELGGVLLAVGTGSVVALPLSGPLVARWGSRRTTAAAARAMAAALLGLSAGLLLGVVPVLAALLVLGASIGIWDVAMNVQAAVVEQHLHRAVLSRFHAGFSAGTVAGALVAAPLVALRVPVSTHLLVVAALVALVVPQGARRFLLDQRPDDAGPLRAREGRRALSAWREPRTLLIGLLVLAFAFTEGTANDWIGVALIDGYRAPEPLATLGFAVFLAAMTAGRWFGTALLDRHGRVPVVRACAVLALAGLALFVFGPGVPAAFVGALLWGAGASLGFPVGMSAAADDPARAAGRVGVVASIAYSAFLCGPPLIGFLGQHSTVLRALLSVAVLLAVAAAVSGALRAEVSGRS